METTLNLNWMIKWRQLNFNEKAPINGAFLFYKFGCICY